MLPLLRDVALPYAIFLALQAFGYPPIVALSAGGVVSLAVLLHGLLHERRVQLLPVFVLATLAAKLVVAMFTGDPRFYLAQDAALNPVFVVVCFGSLVIGKPVVLLLIRWAAASGRIPHLDANELDELWARAPRFRRRMRIMTAVWGGVFVFEGLFRVAMAYLAPLAVAVPVLQVSTWVTYGLMGLWTAWYGRRGRSDQPAAAVAAA